MVLAMVGVTACSDDGDSEESTGGGGAAEVTCGSGAADGIAVLLIEQFTDKALAVATTTHVMSGGVVAFSGPAATLASSPEIIHAAYLGVRATPAGGASHA
jgi:hypothetical protein